MRVTWTEAALDDLTNIVERIRKDNPDAAQRVAKDIFSRLMSLRSFPYRGRRREEDSSLELVFAPWSYIAVYEVTGERIYIKAIRHTSRDWSH